MKITETGLQDACFIEIDPHEDSRGFFARLWCRDTFREHGINMDIVQASVSHNARAGTLRGLHFQWPPSLEGKLVRCQRGSVFDVIVDLRPDSPTFTRHVAVQLDSRQHNAVYVPPGFAHGFQTLEANSDIVYMMSDVYCPELAGGVRYNDPLFEINWPLPADCMAERDRDYPDFNPAAHRTDYLQALKAGDPDGDDASQHQE